MSLKFLIIVSSVIFFILGLITLPHYGINWDTINHLPRGQAYLHYFLTEEEDYSKLNPWKFYYQDPQSLPIRSDAPLLNRRSFYQNDGTPFYWFMEHDGNGHPPVSDILSSVFNMIFFQKLGIINDVDSYRVYSVFLSALLVGLVFFWASKAYGKFAGIVSVIALIAYPLFFSEFHFNNEKDIPETVFWAFSLFSLWWGAVKSSWKWVVASGVFLGLALGTKFNILFAIPIILIWLLSNFRKIYNLDRRIILALASLPFAALAIFIMFWPYLWGDPLSAISKVLGFYKNLGLTLNRDPAFTGPFGIQTLGLQWVIYSTPLATIFLGSLGMLSAVKRLKKEEMRISLLFLLWFLVPIFRVMVPGTNIYGGIRQIMEYIPALAILSGLGAITLRDFLLKRTNISKLFIGFLIMLMFLPIIVKLIQIHPNENVYFNPLIGGLKGAKDRDFPSWGNSFGSVYRQGLVWLNKNAEPNSTLVLAYELHPNIPIIWVRRDITLQNRQRSGYLRKGEYAMTLVYQGLENRSYYDVYLNKFLNPVYEVKVDGVAILKIWKNDDAHLKYPIVEEEYKDIKISKQDYGLLLTLNQEKNLSRLEISYEDGNCKPLNSGYVEISVDQKSWEKLPGVLPVQWRISALGKQPDENHFIEPFVGQTARFIRLVLDPVDTCLTNVEDFKLFIFNNLSNL